MRNKTFAAMAILAVMMISLWATSGQAMEDKQQFGLFLNGDQKVNDRIKLTFSASWTNFAGTTLPYTYLGLQQRINDHFSLGTALGYGFEDTPQDSGMVYALMPAFSSGKWSLYNDFEYWSGLNCLFTLHALTYPVGPVRLGIDERTFYYFDSEDAAARTYRIGPSLRIPFSEQAQVGLFYWYSFENDGLDANVFNMSLMLNF